MDNRQLTRQYWSDVRCITCGHWFPVDNTRHYCPLLSDEVVLVDGNAAPPPQSAAEIDLKDT